MRVWVAWRIVRISCKLSIAAFRRGVAWMGFDAISAVIVRRRDGTLRKRPVLGGRVDVGRECQNRNCEFGRIASVQALNRSWRTFTGRKQHVIHVVKPNVALKTRKSP